MPGGRSGSAGCLQSIGSPVSELDIGVPTGTGELSTRPRRPIAWLLSGGFAEKSVNRLSRQDDTGVGRYDSFSPATPPGLL